jgi:hypothetical protein
MEMDFSSLHELDAALLSVLLARVAGASHDPANALATS